VTAPGVVRVVFDCENQFHDATQLDHITAVGRLKNGTMNGKSAIVIEITLANGKKMYGQTTLAIMDSIVSMMNIRDDMEASEKR